MSALCEYLNQHPQDEVKLHLGCGGERWKDFINVDLHPGSEGATDSSRSGFVADVVADIRDLGLPDGSVAEIFSSHALEHFVRWEAIAMLTDWHRILRSGGRLVVETPDFWRCVLWLFHPSAKRRQLARPQFYGNQWDGIDYETHRYVWSGRELRSVLADQVGFSRVRLGHRTRTHHAGRDMRVVALK